MKKLAMALTTMVAAMSCAQAAHVIPLLSMLPGRVTSLEQQVITVQITAPTQQESGWEKVAALYTGCVAEGKRASESGRRPAYKFHTLKCSGKAPIAIKGVALSSREWVVGLKMPASVGTSLTVLLTKPATVE